MNQKMQQTNQKNSTQSEKIQMMQIKEKDQNEQLIEQIK